MADAFVSAILQQIATIIDREVQQEVKLAVGVEKEVQKLTSNLQAVQAILEDAERKQLKDSSVKDWLNKLKDVSYDMDNVLDEWSTAILKQQIEGVAENATFPKKMVRAFLPSPCLSLNRVILRRDIALKIKAVSERLDVIAKEKDMFHFNLIKGARAAEPERPRSTSFVDVSRVRGRDHDKENIVSKLLCQNTEETREINVISITGMGGIGKTTLAQLAYNDDEVKRHFDRRIWVCVSDAFDEIRIAKAIIEVLNGATPNLAELERLLQNISESIEGKKFLLVLDDVWTEDYTKWEPFKSAFKRGAPGSRIVVTTRKETVAKMMETTHFFQLGVLSREECWSLFSQIAFYGRALDECEELTEIGRQIADKCKGLPLAAKILGGLMQFKTTSDEWHNVLYSDLWEIEEVERGLFPPLLLSYSDLPAAIRRCFSYCSVFPKDHVMQKDELIKLWMAQGYLIGTRRKEMELVGEEYIKKLAMCSFFQDFEEFKVQRDFGMKLTFKMHDIVHDFAQFLGKNECFAVDVDGLGELRVDSSCEKARHLRMILARKAPFPVSIYKAKNLRSLFIKTKSPLIGAVLPELFQHVACLRSLDLSESSIKEIPCEVGKLIHLRYLDLSENPELQELPEIVSNLCNLQYLDLERCTSLNKLPQGMRKLTNLRHLIMSDTSLSFMPKGMERLSSLRTLTDFIVCGGEHKSEAANLGELKTLDHIGGTLIIENLGNILDVGEALNTELKNKKSLLGLDLDFGEEIELRMNDNALLAALQPPSGLRYLGIWAYRGTLFASWLMSLAKLRKVILCGCTNCELLPPLGRLPSLKELEIYGPMRSMRRLGVEFLGTETAGNDDNGKQKKDEGETSSVTAFPKLKELMLWKLGELEEWEGIRTRTREKCNATIMPQLQKLDIRYCPKLKALPDYILTAPCLEKLDISECPILRQSYQPQTGKDWHKVSRIPRINFF